MITDGNVMTMSHMWPNSKAVALIVVTKITKVESQKFSLQSGN